MVASSSLRKAALIALAGGIAYVLSKELAKKQRLRRFAMKDRQTLLYSPFAMHSVTYVKSEDPKALCTALARALEAQGSKLIYAGHTLGVILHSEQLPKQPWDAVVLVQHSSRAAATAACAAKPVADVLSQASAHYTSLMRRWLPTGVLIPLLFSLARVAKIVTGPFGAPFTPASPEQTQEMEESIGFGKNGGATPEELEAAMERANGGADKAIVVFNFVRAHADPVVARRNAIYGFQMMRMLGEVDAGMQHLGSMEFLPGQKTETKQDAFELTVVVYYPGRRFLHDLMHSTWMASVGKGKKEGDTLAVATYPMELEL